MEQFSLTALSLTLDQPIYIIPDTSKPELKKTISSELVILVAQLNDKEKEFLSKILAAVGLSENSVIINHNLTVQFSDLSTNKILSFGGQPAEITYQLEEKSGKVVLSVDEIGKIMNDVSLKKKLWTALQRMFSATE